MLAKIIVTGQTFKDAVSKLKLALEETTITGVETNINFLIAVLSDVTFTSDSLSQVHVKSLEEKMDSLVQVTAQLDEQRKRMASNKRDTETVTTATAPSSVQFKPGDAFNIEIVGGGEAAVHSLQIDSISINNFPDELVAITQTSTHKQPLSISITKKSGISSIMRRKANPRHQAEVGTPLTGMLVEINVNEGDRVQVGQQLYVISAMKMETVVNSPISGNVKYIYAKVNDLVESGDLIIELLKPKENKL